MDFLNRPTTDFSAVRDGRTSMPLWLDIDLSSARSIAAGSSLVINIAGNSFYVDADTVNVGVATLHFQDTNLGNSSAPFVAAPGFVANVAFTQILIENAAQVGKRLRVFYGVDIDFRAGVNASVISGTVSVTNTRSAPVFIEGAGMNYGASYKSGSVMAANTPDTVFAPGANVNGAIIHRASFAAYNGSQPSLSCYIAKASAPATNLDGDVILSTDQVTGIGAATMNQGKLEQPIRIAAGKGLYYISGAGEVNYAHRSVLYTLL